MKISHVFTSLLLALTVAIPVSLFTTGCSSTGGASIAQPSETGPFLGDPVLYNAKNTLPILYATVSGVLTWEMENRAILREKAPAVVAFADNLRDEFPKAMREAVLAVDAYEAALRAQKAGAPPPDASGVTSTLALVNRLANAALSVMLENRSSL